MGWSWALFLCHEAALQIARPGSPWNDGILREERATPQLSEYNTLLGVYVDNITVIGKNQDEVDQRCQVLEAAFKDADIPITWTQHTSVTRLESVVCVLDFDRGVIMNKPSRVWRFASATEALLRRRNAEILQVWCGHYTALCGITYPLESVIWKSMRVHEKWRFISMPEELKQLAKNQDVESFSNMLSELLAPIYENDTGDPRDALTAACLPQAATLSTSYAEYVIESLREGSWLQTSAARAQLHAKPSKRFDLEIPALVEPLDERLADETQYRLLWARRWKYSDENI